MDQAESSSSVIIDGFKEYFRQLPSKSQVPMYEFLGKLISKPLYLNALQSSCNAKQVDLRQLLQVCPEKYRTQPTLDSLQNYNIPAIRGKGMG